MCETPGCGDRGFAHQLATVAATFSGNRPCGSADPSERRAIFVARASQMRLRMRGETTLTDMSKPVK
jgi:hypothetical protein